MENNMYMLLENSTIALEFFKRKATKYTKDEVKKIVSEVRNEIKK